MPVKDGPSCPGCGLPNYEGLCPHCRGDQGAYEAELVPPFEPSLPQLLHPLNPASPEQGQTSGCPDDPICQTCPAASEDDVCLPHERAAIEAAQKEET